MGITVVSGLPRSGTSLMMQMLAAGGMAVLTDGVRGPDESNPKGYFEYEPVKRIATDASWIPLAEGKAVKVVYALLRFLPAGYRYRVIMMRRDPAETVASQTAMLRRSGRQGAAMPEERLRELFARELEQTAEWLAGQSHFKTLEVEHRTCLREPERVAGEVNAFLGGMLDEKAMAAMVDARLYRSVSGSQATVNGGKIA